MHFVGVGVSETGPVRASNEDAGFLGPYVALVADGVGGAAAGEVASATAAHVIAALGQARPVANPLRLLEEALRRSVEVLTRAESADARLAGMATTLTALVTDGERVGLAHAGDSRAYLFRAGGLNRITRDDTYVQQLVDDGFLRPAAVRRHPWRHVVTRTLHAGATPLDERPEVLELVLVPGDRLLLCSDGLTDLVPDCRLAEVLALPDAYRAAARLLADAQDASATDNVTFLVVDVAPGLAPDVPGPFRVAGITGQELGALADHRNVRTSSAALS